MYENNYLLFSVNWDSGSSIIINWVSCSATVDIDEFDLDENADELVDVDDDKSPPSMDKKLE